MKEDQHGAQRITMEKIWIQFNESDYQVYNDYCHRYYSILEAPRKRAIHLFLELFEKDLLTVGEHDLGEATLFFSKKCAEIVAGDNPLGKNNASVDLPLYRVCREIPFLIGDLEKIYRLIEKTGITPNYLLVLATFSTIIKEEKNACIAAIDEQDKKKAESVAPAIADIMRVRLGPDAGWEAALHEFAHIVRKFNLVSADRKIDRNCIYLIGPAVISHFDAAVGFEEIQAALTRSFEERELAVFEALLNNKPYFPDSDTDSDSSDDLIFEMLKSVSGGDTDPGSYETVSDPGHPEIVDLPAVISQSAPSRDSGAIIPSGRTRSPYPLALQENYPSRFDIDIGSTAKSLVVMPDKWVDPPRKVYTKPGIPQYSVMFMGIVILILFAITMAATSGIWSPVKLVSNASSDPNSSEINSILSIVENLQRNSTVSAENDQSVNLRAPPVQVTSTIQPEPTKKAITTADVNKHFFAVAFGPDNTKIQKRIPDKMILSMAMNGNYQENDTVLLGLFTAQFNNYSSTDKFHSDMKFGDMANIVMVFSPGSTLNNIEDLDGTVVSKDPETGDIRSLHMTVTIDRVSKEVVYINSDLKGDVRTHWILRGLLDDLGFRGETYDYPDSIFYAGSENTTQLSDIDWKAVQLMYGSKITPGLTSDRVKALLPG
jgi:hypothetical protein